MVIRSKNYLIWILPISEGANRALDGIGAGAADLTGVGVILILTPLLLSGNSVFCDPISDDVAVIGCPVFGGTGVGVRVGVAVIGCGVVPGEIPVVTVVGVFREGSNFMLRR